MHNYYKKHLFLPIQLIIQLFFGQYLFCESSNPKIYEINENKIPQFQNLNSYKNELFTDFCNIVEENFMLAAKGKPQNVIFFKYSPKETDSIFSISSRCCINYDTIATLNNITNASQSISGKTILIPTVQGLFISKKNNSEINSILIEKYANEIISNENDCYEIFGEEFVFLPGLRFDGTTRYYFLDSSLSLPIKKDSYWISSEFGLRKNPFTSDWKNHNGIDLAAAEGTPVYAIKDGIVAFNIANDSTFGNYIIISHDDNKITSVYAHLKQSLVKKGENIKKGDIIGYVGKTGKVTGPHLHFEIRKNGEAQNPEDVLNL